MIDEDCAMGESRLGLRPAVAAAPGVRMSSRSCGFRAQQFVWRIFGFGFPRARARLARWHHPIVHLLGAYRQQCNVLSTIRGMP